MATINALSSSSDCCSGSFFAAWSELRAIARRERRSAIAVFYDFFLRHYLQPRPQFPWIAAAGPRTGDPDFAFARGDYGRDPSLVNRQLYFDVRWANVKIVLGYGDRNAMAHSIEARVPYFDRAFVELLFSLPDTCKIGRGERKRVLRDVARRYVPPEITERADRMGYGTPDEAMIRGPLSEVIAEAVSGSGVPRLGMDRSGRGRPAAAGFPAGPARRFSRGVASVRAEPLGAQVFGRRLTQPLSAQYYWTATRCGTRVLKKYSTMGGTSTTIIPPQMYARLTRRRVIRSYRTPITTKAS